MGGTEDRHIKWSKPNPEKQRQNLYIFAYIDTYIIYIYIMCAHTPTHTQAGRSY